jgi:hypothetical protein
MSNGGLEVVEHDLTRSDDKRRAEDLAASVVPGEVVELRPPVRMFRSEANVDDIIVVHVRGLRIELPAATDIRNALSALNDGHVVVVPDSYEVVTALRAIAATGALAVGTGHSDARTNWCESGGS